MIQWTMTKWKELVRHYLTSASHCSNHTMYAQLFWQQRCTDIWAFTGCMVHQPATEREVSHFLVRSIHVINFKGKNLSSEE
jgi:hypothetical protein